MLFNPSKSHFFLKGKIKQTTFIIFFVVTFKANFQPSSHIEMQKKNDKTVIFFYRAKVHIRVL